MEAITRRTRELQKNKFFSVYLSVLFLFSGWATAKTVFDTVLVPVTTHFAWVIDLEKDSISSSLSVTTRNLTEKAQQAVAIAPRWLGVALEDKFATLTNTVQDKYAQIILDTRHPYIDEVAFTIAHLPNEVIANNSFYSSIIIENVQGIYRADSVLDYVSIIDSGSREEDRDYFSTTCYTVLENGKEVKYNLPGDMYYWFVVFPKLQGEMPAYISPNSPTPTSPSQGKFWRSYLWDHKESGYGALCDTMKGITFLWANKVNSVSENGALGRLSQWCNLIMPWGGGYPEYRWPQPVYLYNQHKGTCSEHGWFASAAGRTALIPVTLTKAPRYDHKWNEFFNGTWIDWEPINGWIDRMDEPTHANDYWADASKGPLNGCFNWRGDGFIWGTTEHYSAVCTLDVKVADTRGVPVDGARVTIDAEGVPGNFLMAGWTGSDGFCRFLLGDGVGSFTGQVQSARGVVNKTTIITNSVEDKRYQWSPTIQGTAKELKMTSEAVNVAGNTPSIKIAFTIDAHGEFVYGKHEYSLYDYSFPCTFNDERHTGTIDFFICNKQNYGKYQKGEPFGAALIKRRVSSVDSFLTVPDDGQQWCIVVSGEEKTNVTAIVDASIKVSKTENAALLPLRADLSKMMVSNGKNSIHLSGNVVVRQKVSLTVYNALGKPVATLFDGVIDTGVVDNSFSVSKLPKGVYFCRVRSVELSSVLKLIVL